MLRSCLIWICWISQPHEVTECSHLRRYSIKDWRHRAMWAVRPLHIERDEPWNVRVYAVGPSQCQLRSVDLDLFGTRLARILYPRPHEVCLAGPDSLVALNNDGGLTGKWLLLCACHFKPGLP